MSLPTISGAAAGAAPSVAFSSAPVASSKTAGSGFAEALNAAKATRLENQPLSVSPPQGAPRAPLEPAAVLSRVERAQGQLESVLALAQSGKTFSPAQLLALQVRIYQASQEVDLAGKVVEKATGGVKQVLQTQV